MNIIDVGEKLFSFSIIFSLFMPLFASSDASGAGFERNTIIIDVRTIQEFEAGHINGAINIPYDIIADKIGSVTEDKNRKIIVYCRSGRRSGIAKNTLEKLGYRNIENGGSLEDMRKRRGDR